MSGASLGAGNYVRLKSAEGHVFIVEKAVAVGAQTIRAMLEGAWSESQGEIEFPDLSAGILEKVIQYLHFKLKYTNSKIAIPEFEVDKHIALELLMAANYLNC